MGAIHLGVGVDTSLSNMLMVCTEVSSNNKYGDSLEWWKMASKEQVLWKEFVASVDSPHVQPAIDSQFASAARERADITFGGETTYSGLGHEKLSANYRQNALNMFSTRMFTKLELPAENGSHRGRVSDLRARRGSADSEVISAYWLSTYNRSYTLLELIELVSPAEDEKGDHQEDRLWIPVNRFDCLKPESSPLTLSEFMWFDDFVATDVVADSVDIVDISQLERPRRRWRRRLQARPKRTYQERVCNWRARRMRIIRKPGQRRTRTACYTACDDCLHACTADDVTLEFTDMFEPAVFVDRISQLLAKRRKTVRQSDDYDIHASR